MDVPIFLAQKNTKNVTKRHSFYFSLLYADTVPLRDTESFPSIHASHT